MLFFRAMGRIPGEYIIVLTRDGLAMDLTINEK